MPFPRERPVVQQSHKPRAIHHRQVVDAGPGHDFPGEQDVVLGVDDHDVGAHDLADGQVRETARGRAVRSLAGGQAATVLMVGHGFLQGGRGAGRPVATGRYRSRAAAWRAAR